MGTTRGGSRNGGSGAKGREGAQMGTRAGRWLDTECVGVLKL